MEIQSAFFLPIEEWNEIIHFLPNAKELKQWQKEILNERLTFLEEHPEDGEEMEQFLNTLESEEND